MIYNDFLTDKNLSSAIRKDMLGHVIDNDDEVLTDAISTAITRMTNKLRGRYDTDAVFAPIKKWTQDKQYLEGTHVYHQATDGEGEEATLLPGRIYLAQNDNSNSEPSEESEDWVLDDPRNADIIGYLTDITLYLLHKRINPLKIPQLRKDNYDEAMTWLVDVRDGRENPDLPLKEDEDGETVPQIVSSAGREPDDWYHM